MERNSPAHSLDSGSKKSVFDIEILKNFKSLNAQRRLVIFMPMTDRRLTITNVLWSVVSTKLISLSHTFNSVLRTYFQNPSEGAGLWAGPLFSTSANHKRSQKVGW